RQRGPPPGRALRPRHRPERGATVARRGSRCAPRDGARFAPRRHGTRPARPGADAHPEGSRAPARARLRAVRRVAGLWFLVAIGCRRPPEAPFVDVTATAGLDGPVPSYDAALADFDGDGRIDIYLGNHDAGAALYRNLGDG